MATISSLIIRACWIIFTAYWFISARTIKVVAERKSWLSSLAYRIPAMSGVVLLWYPKFRHGLNLALTPRTEWMRVVAAVICVCGLLVAIWSRWTLAGNWSSVVTFKKGHELIKTGTYRWVRHPIYTGILLMCLGSALSIGLLCSWIAVLLIGMSLWIKLKQEEALLLQHFPDEYSAYRKRVKALVPFLL